MSNAAVSPIQPGPPVIRTIPAAGTVAGLPRPLTSFIGRERETAAIADRLLHPDVRLLTLTGSGGVGKTRLALHVAERVAARFDHVWYVELVAVRDPALVASTISRALGVLQDAGRTLDQEIALQMLGGRALLVLDNFEQVLAAGPLVADLLRACPALKVLVTSRAPLWVSGEHLHAVPPMTLPDADRPTDPDTLGKTDAVALFVERASSQAPAFALTAANAGTVAGICRALDGLPLAIELAAARVNALSPATIRDRLDERLSLLTEGPRDQPERLRSLRSSIAWSHNLLEHDEQALFSRLAVFAGSWTLEAAEAVVGKNDGALSLVLDGIASLVSMNLVHLETQADGGSRYSMLETVREFAREQLERGGEEQAIRDRHAAYVLALAERNDWAWFKPREEGEACLAVLEAEQANIRSALDWLQRSGNADGLLRLAGRLGGFWVVCGHLEEGETWLVRALAGQGGADTHRAQALGTLTWILANQQRNDEAVTFGEQCLTIRRDQEESDDRTFGTVYCLLTSAAAHRRLGNLEHCRARCEEVLAIADTYHGPEWTRNWAVHAWTILGQNAFEFGDVDRAETCLKRALDLQAARGYDPGTSHIYANQAVDGLGDVARAKGNLPEALRLHRQTLELAWRSRDLRAQILGLAAMAGTLAAAGNWRSAARLFGASESLHERYGYRFVDSMDFERAFGLPEPWLRAQEPFGAGERLREALWGNREVGLPPIPDPEAASSLWDAGRRLSLGDAIAEALAVDPSAVVRNAGWPAGLTDREVEVLRELVTGKSDGGIADALFISRRTVATHVRHIYNKLGVSSRAEAAAWAVRHELA